MKIVKDVNIPSFITVPSKDVCMLPVESHTWNDYVTFTNIFYDIYDELTVGYLTEDGLVPTNSSGELRDATEKRAILISGVFNDENLGSTEIAVTLMPDIPFFVMTAIADEDGNYPENIEDILLDIAIAVEIKYYQLCALRESRLARNK